MEILRYEFMQRAFIVAFFIALVLPTVGNIIILKRLSNISDVLSHSSFAGVIIGSILQFDTMLSAVFACIVAAVLIELLRTLFENYPEISTSVVLSLVVCCTSICSGFLKKNLNLNGILFGSIISVSQQEVLIIIILSVLVLSVMFILYKSLFHIVFSEESACISGIPVRIINFIFTILVAVVFGISTKIIGALVVSSALTIPVITAMQVSTNYKNNFILSIIFALLSNIIGLLLSCSFDVRPGGTIILVSLVIFLLSISIKTLALQKNRISNHIKIFINKAILKTKL
jgi:zinc transport system permease protein